MTDYQSASAAGSDPSIGADQIDAYIESVEKVLLSAAVPAGERVQILGDLETQITDMLNVEPLPISEATIAAVLARLEPPGHFAANYAPEPSTPSAAVISPALRYSVWVLAAAGSCATLILSCLLLLFCAAESVGPPMAVMFLLLLLTSAIATPISLGKGFAQLRSAPKEFCGQQLAIGTALVYWTALPLLLLLFVGMLTEGYILVAIGLAAFAYCHYILLRRIHQHLANPAQEKRNPHSFRDSLWRFTRLSQPTSC